ncbi:MAG: methylenetetrahydrofolate reductase C-terminal domain-containing protein [Desulfobacteraceae bacterium]|nr:methylenetetrahydrofolate reductase C-terminal domain-containing protein [Desulfobacteraceae bacterium]
MLRIFKDELSNPDNFVVTLELVPHREAFGQNTDTLVGIAKDAFSDGRISAVSITDNPGGNPALSPDVLGYEIFKQGMDVIVHFTCRDTNRVGMESRALQLAHMGMKNILALTGDYNGKGFGGTGKPVFDLDSVLLSKMLNGLSEKIIVSGDPDAFFTGCAVSPFKDRKSECIAQYKKLDKKINAGASFVITQLGYDVNKFNALIRYHKQQNPHIPLMASVYLLSPRSARAMNRGRVPGAYVSDDLYDKVISEWGQDPRKGLKKAIQRAAKLGVILKGMGYRGIHIGGVHKSFKTVAGILDCMEQIQDNKPDFLDEIETEKEQCFYYCYDPEISNKGGSEEKAGLKETLVDHIPYRIFNFAHNLFFDKSAMLAPIYQKLAFVLEKYRKTWVLKRFFEDPLKVTFLSCQSCGDCGIQHVAFLCPESGCPKHTRNGPCGGSLDGHCEVYPEKLCIWVRAYRRLKNVNKASGFLQDNVPPRMWELNKTSSWVNFHLNKDHQR